MLTGACSQALHANYSDLLHRPAMTELRRRRHHASCVEFTWEGNNEMDQASGAGRAELQKDGSLTEEIRFHNGDDSTFKARRW
jgi:hypothetical protein